MPRNRKERFVRLTCSDSQVMHLIHLGLVYIPWHLSIPEFLPCMRGTLTRCAWEGNRILAKL